MKAWVGRAAGGPETLTIEDLPVPEPGPDDVLVRVQTVGVNYPDGLLLRDRYQVAAPRPLVPGSEFCGVVESVGTAVTRVRRGDVVIAACGWGALAEYVAVPAERVVGIPENLPRTEAAAFLFTYATAYHALHDAGRLRDGETLLVLGAAGGLGSAAVDIGSALGARVIAAASTGPKVEFAVRRGATDGLVYHADLQAGDQQKALTRRLRELAPRGVDVALDPVGGLYTEPVLRALARGGRHLVAGFTAGIPRVPLNVTLLSSSHIVGVDWRTFRHENPAADERNVAALLGLWQDERIRPEVTEIVPFGSAPSAIARLESRAALGKIVVTVQT